MLAISPAERGLFFEAYVQLGLARASVLTLPFGRLAHPWGIPYFEELRYPHEIEDQEFLKQLRWAIRTAGQFTPWKSNCLAKAVAAKTMLRRRGHTSTLYLGMTTPGTSPEGEVKAHAWLRCGDTWICGVRESRGFRIVAAFAELKDDQESTQTVQPEIGGVLSHLK